MRLTQGGSHDRDPHAAHTARTPGIAGFTYYYPLCIAYVWMLGALWHYMRYEYRQHSQPVLLSWPKVSIVVPCYNEADNVRETIGHLFAMAYPDYEIIAVNDGSTD